jgi:predicted O-linked N-acetylglucosamine transferase (SPINDLY family)
MPDSTSLSTDSARQEARQELQRAQLLFETNIVEAASHLDEAKRLAPDDLEILNELARVQLRLARYVEGISTLDRIVNLSSRVHPEH